jgi:Nif-specific regulatory protein
MADKTLLYEQLDVLRRIATHLAVADDLYKALRLVLDWLAEGLDFQRGVITLITDDSREVQAYITTHEIPAAKSSRMRYRAGEGITGKVFASGEAIYLPEITAEHEFLDRSGLRQALNRAELAFYCVPISYHGTVIGTFSVDKQKELVADSLQDLEFLAEVAQLLAPFVQRQRLESRLELFQRARQPDGAFAKLIGKSTPMEQLQKHRPDHG